MPNDLIIKVMTASQTTLLVIYYAQLAATALVFALVGYRVLFVKADLTGSEEYFARNAPVSTTDASILHEDRSMPFISQDTSVSVPENRKSQTASVHSISSRPLSNSLDKGNKTDYSVYTDTRKKGGSMGSTPSRSSLSGIDKLRDSSNYLKKSSRGKVVSRGTDRSGNATQSANSINSEL